MSQKYVYVVQKDYDYQDQTDAFPLHAFSNSNFDEAKTYAQKIAKKDASVFTTEGYNKEDLSCKEENMDIDAIYEIVIRDVYDGYLERISIYRLYLD